jgi:hypothetical protein
MSDIPVVIPIVSTGGQVPPISALPPPTATVNFANQQAMGLCIENRTADPATPGVGRIWLRTDL